MSEAFAIDTLAKAEWAMKRIARHEKEIKDLKREADQMKADVDKWLGKEIESHTKSADSLKALLQTYFERETEGTDKKSISLPSGRFGTRKAPPTFKFTVEDEAVSAKSKELLKWLHRSSYDTSHYITTETIEKINWNDYKKTLKVSESGRVFTEDGEEIPGLIATTSNQFYVKTGTEEN